MGFVLVAGCGSRGADSGAAGAPSRGGAATGGALGGFGGDGAGLGGTGGNAAGTGGNAAGTGGNTAGNDASGGGAGLATFEPCNAACLAQVGAVCSTTAPVRCTHPSCAALTGAECSDGGDCCASLSVSGATFTEGPDPGDGATFSATVASFRLDKYEVTVARFRAFIAAYDAWHGSLAPHAGDGANPNVAGSGWSSAWDGSLPASSSALHSELSCGIPPSWTDSGHDTLPMNCVDWYEAFAFCIWDGGRLPSESEWENAARDGSSDWTYPWGDTPVPTDMQDATTAYANYYCLGAGPNDTACDTANILPVGSKPAGRGAFGQDDLAGSISEWLLDAYAPYPSSPSANYASLSGTERVARGGDWLYNASYIKTTTRDHFVPTVRTNYVGFRCARD